MKPHIIDETGFVNLQEMVRDHLVLLAKGVTANGRDMKTLEANLRKGYIVRLRDTIKYEGMQLFDAVEAYNDLY